MVVAGSAIFTIILLLAAVTAFGLVAGLQRFEASGPLDQSKIAGAPLLDRRVRLRVSVPAGAAYTVRHYRIDTRHSIIVPAWERMRGGAPWPTPDQWAELGELNTLDELRPAARAAAGSGGMLEFGFDLPMPAVSYLELVP